MRSTSAIEVDAFADLLQAVVAQAQHAFGERDVDHRIDGGALEDQRADRLGDGHDLIQRDAATVAGGAAARAADGLERLGRRRVRVRRAPTRGRF